MVLQQVPIIDIAPFLGGDSEDKRSVAAQMKQAREDIGFFVITGHGVAPDLIQRVKDVSTEFFDLPQEEKLLVERWADDVIRGYSRPLKECLAESLGNKGPGDLKESYTIGPIDVPNEPYYHCAEAGQHFVENRWPQQPTELRDF
jgi:isopenicillin N synthase-like dioxygenase